MLNVNFHFLDQVFHNFHAPSMDCRKNWGHHLTVQRLPVDSKACQDFAHLQIIVLCSFMCRPQLPAHSFIAKSWCLQIRSTQNQSLHFLIVLSYNCIIKRIFCLLDIFLHLYFPDIFSGEDTDMECRILRDLSFSDDWVEGVDQRIKMETFSTFLSLSANREPNLASA